MKLEIIDLKKNFGEKQALKGISFSVENGIALGLLGRNGAGKTTTIRIIMGVFHSDAGRVLLDGEPIDLKKVKIGYLPEERGLYPKKVIIDQMIYFGQLRGMEKGAAREAALKLLGKFDMQEIAKQKLETLSKGNQQKIQIAIAFINDPDIIILDEPFSGLDPVNSQLLKDIIHEAVGKNKIVLFSSHQMGYVEEFCENIIIINHGKVVLEGHLAQIKRQYQRNRLFVLLEDKNMALEECVRATYAFLSDINNPSGYIEKVEATRDGCIIVLKEEKDKQTLLNHILSQGKNIDVFKVLEPTLEELFIEKAGEE